MTNALVIVALFVSGSFAGQPEQPPVLPEATAQEVEQIERAELDEPRTPDRPIRASKQPELKRYTANSIARVALLDVRQRPKPAPEDFRVVEQLIGLSQQLLPDDAELVRRRIEAAFEAGDHELFMEQTRRLIVLDPADTVAQLRLISNNIRNLQTIEARLGAYDRLLGDRGKSLDPSVRSRLALDSALLYREQGNQQAFVDRLTMATALDSTNKEAAMLAATFFAERVADNPPAFLEMLVNVLMADPTDPNSHIRIAAELVAQGAFESAQRFYGSAGRILSESGELTQAFLDQQLVMLWQVNGPDPIMEELNNELAARRADVQAVFDDYESKGLLPPDIDRPEDTHLSPDRERIRLLAADAIGDADTLAAAAADYHSSSTARLEVLVDEEQRPFGMTLQEARVEAFGMILEMFNLLAIAKVDPELLYDGRSILERMGVRDRAITDALDAWIFYRTERYGRALALFEAAPTRSVNVLAGEALCYLELGEPDKALERFRTIARSIPTDVVGAWARSRAIRLSGEIERSSEYAETMHNIAASIPYWVDRMTFDEGEFVSMSATMGELSPDPLEPVGVRVVIRNMSRIPLAVGSDRPINSKILFAPRLVLGNRNARLGARPEVYNLNRRLRLMPRETIEAVLWPEVGDTGWVADVASMTTTRLSWRVLQGFRTDEQRVVREGALCATASTGTLVRAALPEALLPPDQIAAMLRSAPEEVVPTLFASVRARLLTFDEPLILTTEEVESIAQAAADRYPTLSPIARQLALTTIPPAFYVDGMQAFDEAVMSEEDASVLPLVLVTRGTDGESAAFERALASTDPRLVEMANILIMRTGEERPRGYATLRRSELERRMGFEPTAESAE